MYTKEQEETITKLEEVYDEMCPNIEAAKTLNRSINKMMSEKKKFVEIIKFISTSLTYGLSLNRW